MTIPPRGQGQSFFVVGGTLRPDAPSYVERPADQELPALIRAGHFTYVLTARQMGKSSLINRTAYHLRKEGVQTVLIDLTGLGSNSSEEEWYFALLQILARQLRLTLDFNAWWDGQRVGMVPRFIAFLEDIVLSECQGAIVIFVDEIDVTLNLPFSDDFFAAIRALYNARAQKPIFDRLTFVLAGVASPTDLIKDRTRTPFNVGQGILLQDFSRSDAERLQIGLEQASLSQAATLLMDIYQWTDGHPYLTQKLCQAIIEQEQKNWDTQQIDDLVETLFLGDRSLKEDNFKSVQDKLLSHPQQRQLLTLYRQVYRGQQLPDEPQSLLQNQLKLSGLVKTEHGHLKVRNQIYRQVFDLTWINAHTAIDWVRIVAGVAVLLVLVLSSLLAQSTWTGIKEQQIKSDFYTPHTNETEQMALLVDLFELQAYLPAWDYDYRAKDLFYSLSPEDQLALFKLYDGEEADLLFVIKRLYTTLADVDVDVDESDNTRYFLEAMSNALGRFENSEEATKLANEITNWLEGRALYRQNQYTEALTQYDKAIALNKENPATLYERARLFTKLAKYPDALRDFDKVIAVAKNQSFAPTPTPTLTLIPSSTIAPYPSPPIFTPISYPGPTFGIVSYPLSTFTPISYPAPTFRPIPVPTFTPSPSMTPSPSITANLSPTPYLSPTPTTPPPIPTAPLTILASDFDASGEMITVVRDFIERNRELGSLLVYGTDQQYTNLSSLISSLTVISLPNTPIPEPIATFSADNASQVKPLARWGKGRISEVNYSPDGKLIAVASSLGLSLYDAQTLEELRFIETWALSIAFSADGKLLASGSPDGTVRLWSPEGQLLNTLEEHSWAVWSVALSPDGKLLASASSDETVRLWSTEGQLLNTLEEASGSVLSVAFSADGKLLASGSNDSTVQLWSTEGQLLKTLSGYSFPIRSLAFSPDGKHLASGSNDSTVRLWSTEGQLLNTLEGHSGAVVSVAFSADGKLLASGSLDGTVRLWSTEGQLLNTLEAHSSLVLSVAFSADGQLLVSGSGDGTIRLWGVRP